MCLISFYSCHRPGEGYNCSGPIGLMKKLRHAEGKPVELTVDSRAAQFQSLASFHWATRHSLKATAHVCAQARKRVSKGLTWVVAISHGLVVLFFNS